MTELPFPAVASVAFANLLMALVFAALHARERKPALALFAVTWTLEALRHALSLAPLHPVAYFAECIALDAALLTLAEGSMRFASRPPSIAIRSALPLLMVWHVVVWLWNPPFIVWHLPISAFVAAVRAVTARMLWIGDGSWLGRRVATFAMSLWAVHALSYPFLATVPPAAEWGFAVSASLGLLTALGVLMAYFERARDEADANEAGLRAIFDGASDGIATLDREGRIVMANPALVRMLGFDDASELEGQHLSSLVGRDDGEKLSSGKLESWRRKDGERRLVSTSVSGTRTGDRIDVFVRDVTEQTRLEGAIEQARRLEALGRLAGGVAHDFNNLLQVISASIEIEMRRRGEPIEHLEIALGAARRGAELAKQLLAFGRGQRAAPRRIDLTLVVRELGQWVTRLLGDHLSLELETPDRPLVVRADRGQVEQILVNLVTNARDAMPEGGRIRLGVRADGDRAVLEVEDDGAGMDEATRARIFEPFFTKKAGGTGLGLATVHGICAQHGWDLSVRSAPGEGTTFRLVLPAAPTDEPESAEQTLDPAIAPSGARVMLADDDAEVRRLFAEMLGEAGYVVRALAPSELAQASFEDCDVLVTDVQMAGSSGPELARRARADRPDIGIVFVSGYTAKDVGPLDARTTFVAKPCTADELMLAIERVRS